MATLLVIDDSPAHRAQILAAVEPADLFDRIIEAGNGIEGLKLLLAEPIDVVLCDLEMPGLDGEELLRFKESRPERRQVPLLFLSAVADTERKVRLLEGGACDTILKPFHPMELVARLRLHLQIKLLQDELRDKNEILSKLSITDELTSLHNRRFLNEVIAIEFLRARRYSAPLALLMADLDHFKRVNDQFGHPAGDSVLKGVADILRHNLRATDVGGRYGGEEFVVVMPQNTSQGAAQLAERWRAAVEQARFTAPDGRTLAATLSVGVASYLSAHGSPENLLADADAALYRAKQAGRNRVEIWGGD